ncbi:unnamed protein product [Cercopithifilaria johnstoni]|uniref:Uncharacterized protein n=1 Tax=Cercopithifilaria johnstoni TaxID=2874296 RepID=A0A8J2LX73_9BILA|nr:unnamed protein product [Cercopithifilaria johnstoni]
MFLFQHFNNFDRNRLHISENNKRNIHGVPELEPKVSGRSVSPVRPITSPVSSSKNTSWHPYVKGANNNYNRLNKPLKDGYRSATPIPSFDILPASIPRIEINKAFNDKRIHCNTTSTFYDHSPRSDDSCGFFSHSTHSDSADTIPSGNAISIVDTMIPLKKITKESRWVSVHDGRPVTPYIKTVAYVPKYSNHEYVQNTYNGRNYHCNNGYNVQSKQVSYKDEKYASKANTTLKSTSSYDPCSIFVENPSYKD